MCIIRFDLHRLVPVGVADGIAVNGLHFSHNNGTDHTVEHDLTGAVCVIKSIAGNFSILVREEIAVSGSDLEGHALQRSLPVRGAVLVNHEFAGAGILKDQAVGHALLDLDGLGRHIPHIPVGSFFLGNDQHLSRLEAGNGDKAVPIRGVPAIVCADGRAVLIRHMEYRAGQRGFAGTLLQDGQ